jgi:hypothetical protein
MVVWNCNGGTGVVCNAESKVVSHIAPEVDSSKAAYPPPLCATRVGVPYSIFPRYFQKRSLNMNDQAKLQKELHSVVLGLLRQGFTLQSVIHALIVESEKMSESATVVQAIEDFNQQTEIGINNGIR